MGKVLNWILRQIIGGWLSGGALALIIAWLGWLQAQPWYLIFAAAIVVFWVTFWGFKQRAKKKLSQYSDEETKTLVRKWIDRPNFKVERIDKDDALFSFVFESATGIHKVEVIRTKKEPH